MKGLFLGIACVGLVTSVSVWACGPEAQGGSAQNNSAQVSQGEVPHFENGQPAGTTHVDSSANGPYQKLMLQTAGAIQVDDAVPTEAAAPSDADGASDDGSSR